MSNRIKPHCDLGARSLVTVGAFFLVFSFSAVARAQSLKWEVVNSFRFIHDKAAWNELRRIYALTDGSASDLERKLQLADEQRVDAQRLLATSACASLEGEKKDECLQKSNIPYSGWFATLAKDSYRKTCWDPGRRRMRKIPPCVDYANPTKHTVRVWMSDTSLAHAPAVHWLLDGEKLKSFDNCSQPNKSSACIEFEIAHDPTRIHEVTVDGHPGLRVSIQVEDKLIVGLGDSFAAGEGNPDRPAQFVGGRSERDLKQQGIIRAPKRDRSSSVAWLDSRCHRSMYSYQFKTALQFALAHPQTAVTFVSFACTGAVTDDIFRTRQNSKEGVFRWRRVPIQLESLRSFLKADDDRPAREIDYLLLSTGGNDVGFAEVVASVITRGKLQKIFEKSVNNVLNDKTYIDSKLLGLEGKAGNYTDLVRAFQDPKKGIRVKGCQSGKCRRILLTLYPNILNDEKGELCRINRGEFDGVFGKDDGREARLSRAKGALFSKLADVQRRVTSLFGWTIVDDHVEKYSMNGFCAQLPQTEGRTGELFGMPIKRENGWGPFEPWEYRPYEQRARWARLPVDSKLTVDQSVRLFRLVDVDFAYEDDLGTIMHPTAEGLSVTAQANLIEIQSIEQAGTSITSP